MGNGPPLIVDIVYENHLKHAYLVKDGRGHLAITDTSCYALNPETSWLIGSLPAGGGKEFFLASLSTLGLQSPQKIFDKLVAIGALHIRQKRSWKDIFRTLLAPKIKLISAQAQERIFLPLLPAQSGLVRYLPCLSGISTTGLLWGILSFFASTDMARPLYLSGSANGLVVFLLVVCASLIHELGHSFTAMASGIGFRPIGFSIYLIYPVFYTNVSGIERIPLGKRVFINCGGFIFQGIFLFSLLLISSTVGSPSSAEAVRWISLIVLFNLNPFFMTDGYWLYKDAYSEFKSKQRARALHHIYLVAFTMFSIWFLWRVGARLGEIWRDLNMLLHSPGYFFSGGHRIILAVYFVILGVAGSLHRFRETSQEWKELRETRI